MRVGDGEFIDITITGVETIDTGWVVRVHAGELFVTNKHCDVPPQRGELLRLYGPGLYKPIRGIRIGDRVYRYRSAEDQARLMLDDLEAAVLRGESLQRP